MRIRPILAIILRQFYLMQGSVARIMPLFIWVAIDIVLWGFITKYLNTFDSGHNFVSTLLGAVLLWDFLTRVLQGVTLAFFEDVWSRNFLNIFASPLSIAEYISGLVLSSVLTSIIGLVVMFVMACSLFGFSFFSYGAMLVPFLMILFLFGIALGIFSCALVLRMGPAAEWFIWPIPALISPFVGVFYPLATLPHWMQGVAQILPPSYVFENMRLIVSGEAASMQAMLIGLVLAFIYIFGACFIFTLTYKRAIRTGLIARYSAESVS